MRTTIADVARLAGVSNATVSRVINANGHVDAGMREKVQAAMEQLGYVPNSVAQSLRQLRSRTIGITTSDLRVSYFPQIVSALERALQPRGYALFSAGTREDPKTEQKVLVQMCSHMVAALVVCSTGQNEEQLTQIAARGTPVILYDRRPLHGKLPSVYVDRQKSMHIALAHLFALGHRRIALISGAKALATNYDRYIGVQQFAYTHDADPAQFPFCFGEYSEDFGQSAIAQLLALPQPPTAVITGSVAITAGILQHCRAQGIRVPADLALVSTGTFAYPGIIEPSLTHLDDCVEETAAKLLALLEQVIVGEPVTPDICIAIEPVLRIGASTVRQESLSGI